MKLKYHKIRGVNMDVCTAEQKIAYNIAFRLEISYGDIFRKHGTLSEAAKAEAIARYIQKGMRDYTLANENSRYNVDAIFAALNAGLKNYLESSHHILTSYAEVGEAFPANYR